MRPRTMLARLGMMVTWGGLLAGLLVSAYALARAVHHLVYVGFAGEKEAVRHLVLYPLGLLAAGSLVAVLGVVVMYIVDRAMGGPRSGAADGTPNGASPL